MNINEIPEPPIKPSKDPGIMKDQDREAAFHHQTQSSGPAVSDHRTAAESATSQVARALFTPAEGTNKQTGTLQTFSKYRQQNKSGSSSWAIFGFIFAFFFIGNIVVSVFQEIDTAIDEFNTSDTVPLGPTEDTSPELPATNSLVGTEFEDIEFERVSNACISFEVPVGTIVEEFSGDCSYDFQGGFILGDVTFESGLNEDGSTAFVRDTPEEYFSTYDITVLEELEVNGITVYRVNNNQSLFDEYYLFWLFDENLTSEEGVRLTAMRMYFYSTVDETELKINERVLNSAVFSSSLSGES